MLANCVGQEVSNSGKEEGDDKEGGSAVGKETGKSAVEEATAST